eukprot:8717402-Karenia_brevis.AAC.1
MGFQEVREHMKLYEYHVNLQSKRPPQTPPRGPRKASGSSAGIVNACEYHVNLQSKLLSKSSRNI